MKELSLHILDIAMNSVSAKASLVKIFIDETPDALTITIADNGCGMTPDFVARVLDPFTTTRTTRKVGMGLPLFKLAAEQTGGTLDIHSVLGEGTTVKAAFGADSIDLPPLGDMPDTVFTLISAAPDIDFHYRHTRGENISELETVSLRAALEDVPLDTPDVLTWIRDSIREMEENL